MAHKAKIKSVFEGFSKLTLQERLAKLFELGALSQQDVDELTSNKPLEHSLAENFIENVIGYYQLPLGVGVHLKIDEEEYTIPMAVEETSIVASLSKTAKWISNTGNITTETLGNNTSIGQIQFSKIKDFNKFEENIISNKLLLVNTANETIAAGLVKRGGGVKDIIVRKIERPDDYCMGVVHVLVDTRDAMGANIITQICEYLKEPLQSLTSENVSMCILSNLNNSKLVRATVTIKNIDPRLGNKVAEASLFAALDPYRAATNNKGVLNGIDPIVIATGNDWRAVEASIHSYAARNGQYQSLTAWKMEGKNLVGQITVPIPVGIVGGVTKLHPTAKMCLKMLNVKSADHLSRVLVAVGLVQNLGAITALTTVGLIQGHMRLHISNLSLTAGANSHEMPILQSKLESLLSKQKIVTLSNATELLKEIRENEVIPA